MNNKMIEGVKGLFERAYKIKDMILRHEIIFEFEHWHYEEETSDINKILVFSHARLMSALSARDIRKTKIKNNIMPD